MEVVITVLGAIVGKITERLITPVERRIHYVADYKEIIKKLEDEFEELCDKKTRVQGKVDSAMDNGEIIEHDVWKWIKRVLEIEEEVKRLSEDRAVKENKRCFKNWCPDFRLSKEAEKKTMVVTKLKEDGNFDPVGHPAPHPGIGCTSATDYVHFGSRADVIDQIKKALEDDTINVIGVYGMGGAGKTTLVQEVGKQVKGDKLFDEVVMVVVSQTLNVRHVQGQLADQLNQQLRKETEIGRAGELLNRLQDGKKILIIVDDVWNEINLKEVGIPFADGVKGCKIVITSRNQAVCRQMKVQKDFPIGVLSEDESWTLFKKKVGNLDDSPEMHSVARDVCRECGGLPVAIRAVGATLMIYRDKHFWDDALEQRRNSRLPDIVASSLELSYNYLGHAEAKSCLLLCCLFPEDAEISIDALVRYVKGMGLLENENTMEKARNRTHSLIHILKTSCLLLEGRDENTVKMHDVIRDVAISIASKKEPPFLIKTGVQEWPEKYQYENCTAISLRFSNFQELPEVLECPELHIPSCWNAEILH